MGRTGRYTDQMMKKPAIIAVAVAAVVAIGGGVGVAAAANLAITPEPSTSAVASASGDKAVATDTPSETPTPTPTADAWPYTKAENGEATYLTAVKAPDSINGIQLPSDEELIADARKACDQLAAGVPFDAVNVIADNPNPPMMNGKRSQVTNSRSLAGLASETLCTEYNQQNVAP